MSERLKELQRQRALVQEQAAWLDREIAREAGGAVPPAAAGAPVAPVVAPAMGAASIAPAGQHPAQTAEEILALYKNKGRSPQEEIKRGCLIYFIAALTLLAVSLSAIMLWKYSN